MQPECNELCTEDWSPWEPCSHECWSTEDEFENVRQVRFKCFENAEFETCYETQRCFNETHKEETECPTAEEVKADLNVDDLDALKENGLGIINIFVDFKVIFSTLFVLLNRLDRYL